ncbi:SURF1 family protein [Tessaracoccus lubricantis]|uniref:SURF1 family cytochrome oxidase biogenesis protein n=1 Tax=Tessaracoccus lubricantis TaxID=545543 RepID=UPI00362F06FF
MTRKQVLRYVAIAVIGVLLAFTFVQLGRWQLDRLDQRRERNATVVAHESEAVRPYTEVMTGEIGDDDQWFRVTATGRYLPQQYQVRYRSLDGAYGSEFLAVLETEQGHHLLVNRGFAPRQGAAPAAELPALPTGTVEVTGFVQRNQRGDENAMTPHDGQLRLINSDVLGRATGLDLIDGYVSLIESSPADDGGLTPLGPPALDEGNHFSYALQWFAFTVIGVIGLVVLIRGDVRERRKARRRPVAPASPLVEPASPASTLVEPASPASGVETPRADERTR